MGLVKFGAFVTDVSGKVGGSIFSKNRGGAYVKNRVVPNNPATTFQSIVRGRFGSLSSQWRTLTQAQRDSFTASTVNFPKSNRIGDTIQLAGNALFVSLNSSLLAVGLPIITVAPSAAGVTEFLIDTFGVDTAGAGFFNLQASAIDPALEDDMLVQIFATPSVSQGISNLNSLFRQIAVVTPAELETLDNYLDDYTAKFGTPSSGSRIGVRVVPVNKITGENGVGTERTSIVSG